MSVGELTRAFAVKGELLGNRVQRVCGHDIHIARHVEPLPGLAIDVGPYLYAYSTVASFAGVVLGHARVYRDNGMEDWHKVASSRMKETLQQFGFSVLVSQYAARAAVLSRFIVAPSHVPKLVISETLFLNEIDFILNARAS